MDFVDRKPEMDRLDGLARAGRGGLAALWGRRRVGKTRLLLEWCRRHGGLYAVADLSAESVQRRYLAETVAARFPGFADVEYPDWLALLRALGREAQRASWKGPVVLDEFPCLVESSPALPSQLQNWLDHEAKPAGLVVAIAGSTRHMMQGLALDPDSPLYGRTLEAMALSPMTLAALAEALHLADPVEAVRAFAAWGGIPRYWELAEPFGRRLDDAVDGLVLDPLGPLHQEPDRLLADERPSAVPLRPLLDAIGAGAHRVSEIGGRIGQPATALSRALSRLAGLGLVVREQPFGESERGGKKTLYRIEDPFFRLWFRVVAPHRGLLASAPEAARRGLWAKHRESLFSETWEALCRAAVPRLGSGRGLPEGGPWGPAARFWGGSGPEWDLVARSLDGKSLLLGEAKWSETGGEDPTAGAMRDLEAKGVPPLDLPRGVRIARVVFVPRRPRRTARRTAPFAILDAGDVLDAFRD
jgi:AAA+ ATPase superfamily predicted ATPase